MSGRSSRTRAQFGSSRMTDNQILELLTGIQQLLPEIHERHSENNTRETLCSKKASASKALQDTCNYIRNLHKEVDDLNEKLSQLLSTIDEDSPEASIIRSLIP